jgi:protein tyrosine/serine phosphatase
VTRLARPGARWLVSGLLAALLLGAAWQAWNRHLRDEVFPRRFAEVEPDGLYRSGQIAGRLVRDVLAEHAIGMVVSLRDHDATRADHRAEREATEALGIERVELHLSGDGTGDPEMYVRAIEAIARARRAGVPVLVHCAAGTRRAGAATALYLLLVEGRGAGDAWRELSRFGEDSLADSPLVSYLNGNLRAIAEGLVARGVIARVPEPLPVLGPPA